MTNTPNTPNRATTAASNKFVEHSVVLTNFTAEKDQVLTKFVLTPEFVMMISSKDDKERVFSLNADVLINNKPVRFTVELSFLPTSDEAKTFCSNLLKQVTAFNSLEKANDDQS